MRVLRPLLVSLGLVVSMACRQPPPATVGDVTITQVALDAEVERIAANASYLRSLEDRSQQPVRDGEAFSRGFIAGVLSQRIHYEVVHQEVVVRGLRVLQRHRERGRVTAADEVGGAPILDDFDARYQRELIERAAWLAALSDDVMKDERIEAYFRAHRADFAKFCTRHLLVETQEEALEARRRIDGGESFADVATDVSLDEGTGPKGGDLGCNGAGDLVPELDVASRRQREGVVSAPIGTDVGWQLLVVEDRIEPVLENVKREVAAALDALAPSRVGAVLKERFETTEITVADRYGRWDPDQRKVVVT